MSYTTIDLLRHGACEGGEIFRGSTDDGLSELGWQQLRRITAHNPGWDQLISSPLKRCRAFAEQLAAQQSTPLTIDENWRETHFGAWEGQVVNELWRQQPEQLSNYFADPGSAAPAGAEQIASFRARINKAWQRVLDDFSGQHVLIVQHGGCIRLLLTSLFNLPSSAMSSFDVPHASLTRIRVYQQDGGQFPVLVFHNPGAAL